MGMAASQARFLCLTARKSNTEYQGQQVNQQRTLLANESAGLYNDMLALEVPVPPNSSNYFKKTYQFAPTSNGSESKYKFTTTPKLVGNGRYQIGVSCDVQGIQMMNKREEVTVKNISNADSEAKYQITFNGATYDLKKVDFNEDGYEKTDIGEATVEDGSDLSYSTAKKGRDFEEDKDYYYFELGEKGKRYYISSDQLQKMTNNDDKESTASINLKYANEIVTQKYGKVEGYLKKSDSGRYDTLEIVSSDVDELKPNEGETDSYKLVITEVEDEDAYEEAMKDYEYLKAKYDKTLEDINSKTAIIQQKDKSLELKLKQLDTEQEALKNELEAVQEVINKNVESTFKTFSA